MRWSTRAPDTQPYTRWFAWHPVSLDDRLDWVWLEWVERRKVYPRCDRYGAFYTYRLIPEDSK